MYSYHNIIKKRIKNGELIGYSYLQNYKNIGECLMLHFRTFPFERPIRPYRYPEYATILSEWQKEQQN